MLSFVDFPTQVADVHRDHTQRGDNLNEATPCSQGRHSSSAETGCKFSTERSKAVRMCARSVYRRVLYRLPRAVLANIS